MKPTTSQHRLGNFTHFIISPKNSEYDMQGIACFSKIQFLDYVPKTTGVYDYTSA
jgi:hypothetical protein